MLYKHFENINKNNLEKKNTGRAENNNIHLKNSCIPGMFKNWLKNLPVGKTWTKPDQQKWKGIKTSEHNEEVSVYVILGNDTPLTKPCGAWWDPVCPGTLELRFNWFLHLFC